MKIKAVIFDLDGTLLNSVEDITDSLNFVLRSYKLEEQDVLKVKDWIGEGAMELVRKAIPSNRLVSMDIQKFLWEYREKYRQNCAVKSHLYKGIPVMLDSLEKMHIKLNILSNKPHELTVLVAQHFFNNWNFKHIIGMRENIPRKPDPTAALEIADNLGLKTTELVYVGDSGTDIETARNAGIKVIAVSWGFRPRPELKNMYPDYLIDQPEELIKILELK